MGRVWGRLNLGAVGARRRRRRPQAVRRRRRWSAPPWSRRTPIGTRGLCCIALVFFRPLVSSRSARLCRSLAFPDGACPPISWLPSAPSYGRHWPLPSSGLHAAGVSSVLSWSAVVSKPSSCCCFAYFGRLSLPGCASWIGLVLLFCLLYSSFLKSYSFTVCS